MIHFKIKFDGNVVFNILYVRNFKSVRPMVVAFNGNVNNDSFYKIYILDRLQRLQSEVNKIEEKNYKISEMENEISDLRSSLKSRLNEIDELKSDLFESSYLNQSKCSDVSITMPAKS